MAIPRFSSVTYIDSNGIRSHAIKQKQQNGSVMIAVTKANNPEVTLAMPLDQFIKTEMPGLNYPRTRRLDVSRLLAPAKKPLKSIKF